MDHDFITARRAIANGSLDWASTVECILKVLYNNNVLSSPLTTFAKLSAHNDETTLDFARRLRKAFFFLPTDMVVGPQSCDVLSQHVRQFLPRTWSAISPKSSTLSNEELADNIVQCTDTIARWPYEDANFKQNLKLTNPAVGLTPPAPNQTIMDPRL
ncbi:hypothetical protein K3495_g1300 [Podosphaera aphanis]|nr:hypothetical protein K3495_g1300 [Podosphaera aphanis]